MKTYRCDACGHEETFADGIAGNEFDYYGPRHRDKSLRKRREFKTLVTTYRTNGVVDVCGKCFDEIVKARISAVEKEQQGINKKVRSAICSIMGRNRIKE